MNPKNRLKLFQKALLSNNDTLCAKSALALLESTLKSIESEHAPDGVEHMTITEDNKSLVQSYGQGGIYIPLIGHKVYINENGAFKITENKSGAVFLNEDNKNSVQFKAVTDFKPKRFGV
jgi:hypothetical protein